MMMTKQIKLKIDRIAKGTDKKYINETIDSIIESIQDFPDIVTAIGIHREKDMFIINFDLKVSKTGDIVFVLVKEYMSCIRQTEPNVEITIDEIEEDGCGTTYKLYNYVPNMTI